MRSTFDLCMYMHRGTLVSFLFFVDTAIASIPLCSTSHPSLHSKLQFLNLNIVRFFVWTYFFLLKVNHILDTVSALHSLGRLQVAWYESITSIAFSCHFSWHQCHHPSLKHCCICFSLHQGRPRIIESRLQCCVSFSKDRKAAEMRAMFWAAGCPQGQGRFGRSWKAYLRSSVLWKKSFNMTAADRLRCFPWSHMMHPLSHLEANSKICATRLGWDTVSIHTLAHRPLHLPVSRCRGMSSGHRASSSNVWSFIRRTPHGALGIREWLGSRPRQWPTTIAPPKSQDSMGSRHWGWCHVNRTALRQSASELATMIGAHPTSAGSAGNTRTIVPRGNSSTWLQCADSYLSKTLGNSLAFRTTLLRPAGAGGG